VDGRSGSGSDINFAQFIVPYWITKFKVLESTYGTKSHRLRR
jgi:hypothetical protein